MNLVVKSLIRKNTILSELSKFNAKQLVNFKALYLSPKWLKLFEIFITFLLNKFQKCGKILTNSNYFWRKLLAKENKKKNK